MLKYIHRLGSEHPNDVMRELQPSGRNRMNSVRDPEMPLERVPHQSVIPSPEWTLMSHMNNTKYQSVRRLITLNRF